MLYFLDVYCHASTIPLLEFFEVNLLCRNEVEEMMFYLIHMYASSSICSHFLVLLETWYPTELPSNSTPHLIPSLFFLSPSSFRWLLVTAQDSSLCSVVLIFFLTFKEPDNSCGAL